MPATELATVPTSMILSASNSRLNDLAILKNSSFRKSFRSLISFKEIHQFAVYLFLSAVNNGLGFLAMSNPAFIGASSTTFILERIFKQMFPFFHGIFKR